MLFLTVIGSASVPLELPVIVTPFTVGTHTYTTSSRKARLRLPERLLPPLLPSELDPSPLILLLAGDDDLDEDRVLAAPDPEPDPESREVYPSDSESESETIRGPPSTPPTEAEPARQRATVGASRAPLVTLITLPVGGHTWQLSAWSLV